MVPEDNFFDDLIENSIDALADDNCNTGAEFLCEIADAMASVGCSLDSFMSLRSYIIESAKKRDQCPALIDIKIENAETKLREMRNAKKH